MKYKVQKINDFSVVISEDNIIEGDWMINFRDNSIWNFSKKMMIDNMNVWCRKIIATISKDMRAEGIPMLVLPNQEEDVELLGLEIYPPQYNPALGKGELDVAIYARNLWIEGYKYKTTQQDKKWSDKDMRKAIILAWDKGVDLTKVDDILHTLENKCPTYVELETANLMYDENHYLYKKDIHPTDNKEYMNLLFLNSNGRHTLETTDKKNNIIYL